MFAAPLVLKLSTYTISITINAYASLSQLPLTQTRLSTWPGYTRKN